MELPSLHGKFSYPSCKVSVVPNRDESKSWMPFPQTGVLLSSWALYHQRDRLDINPKFTNDFGLFGYILMTNKMKISLGIKLKFKDYDDAVRCFDKALEINPTFAEVHNAKAVALSYKGDYDNAVKEVKKAIENKPKLAEAHENLAKLIFTRGKESQGFWDFWSASCPRRIVAILLGLFAIGLTIYPLYIGYETVQTVEEVGKASKTITTTKEPRIPESYIIVLGLIVLMLLTPEIRKVKIGPVEIELSRHPLPPPERLP